MKKYYIRSVSFMFNDEYLFPTRGFGKIKETFDSLDEAMGTIKKMNCQSMRGLVPDQYQPISYCYKGNNDESIQLDAYLQNTFGHRLLVHNDYSKGKSPDSNYSLPVDLSEDQAWMIREISGIKLYDLIEVDEENSGFWGAKLGKWANSSGEWVKGFGYVHNQETGEYREDKVPLIFNSEDQVLNHVEQMLYGIINEIPNGIQGTLEELSEAPAFFKTIIDQYQGLSYDEDTKTLKVQWMPADQFNIFNGLLKDKIIEIVPMSMEEIEEIGTDWDAVM